jgi:hypothetical protein
MAGKPLRRGLIAVLVTVGWVFGLSAIGTPAQAKPLARATLGDYATPLVGPADAAGVKHIDTPATVARLQSAHVNTYAYLIYASPLYGNASGAKTTQAQWDDLPGFATAAALAGITVRVYLVPPSESTRTGYKPYGWDYQSWATAIARLALLHPNIKEMQMDDFGANTNENASPYAFAFTPAYVESMMAAARGIAPWLEFRAVLYYSDFVGAQALLPAYREVLDGVIFPYRLRTPGGGFNTTDASQATKYGLAVSGMTKCHSGTKCAHLGYPKRTGSNAGAYGQFEQTVYETIGAPKTLKFWYNTDSDGRTRGVHYLEALIDGKPVWQSDVGAYAVNTWRQGSIDVSKAMAGKSSARLTMRVRNARGFNDSHMSAFIDDVEGSGFLVPDGGFELGSSTPWKFSANYPQFQGSVVRSRSYDFMTYATKFSGETNPTTPAYVASVLGQALKLMSAGFADGSLIYCLNLTGHNDGRSEAGTYDAASAAYGSYDPLP